MSSQSKAATQNCLSLFCGSGGLDQGFRDAGFRIPLAFDNNASAVETHNFNHPGTTAIQEDLSTIAPEKILERWKECAGDAPITGVIGGPPCEAFSDSNVHKKAGDIRLILPEHYASILRHLNQEVGVGFFLFENVTGLLGDGHSVQLAKFRRMFEEAGFTLFEKELNAVDYGVAQDRPRFIMIGLNTARYGKTPTFEFPPRRRGRKLTVRDKIGGLPEPVCFRRNLQASEIPFHENHWCMNPKSKKFKSGQFKPGQMLGRCFRVLAWNKPSWTVAYGHREMHIHPNCRRRVSIYEGMMLQGFPKHYVLKGNLSSQCDQVSDAVPPPLGKALAKCISRFLESTPAVQIPAAQRRAL